MSKTLMCCCVLCLFPLPDAMWTTKYLEWRGSIAPPFYLQEVRSGLWTLVSSWWKTQQSQSTASRSKMLTSMTKGPMSAQSSQTRNQNPRECISLFKVRPSQPCQWLYSATTNIKRCQTRWVLEQCCCFFFFAMWMFTFTGGELKTQVVLVWIWPVFGQIK